MRFLERLFGGAPLAVLLRLAVVSLLVGAILAGLGLDPRALFRVAVEAFESLFGYGFDVVRNAGRYLVTGALIVIPIWLLTRLFSLRR